jgi:pyruvate dehydrogenase E1 component alpha subunit
MGAEPDTAVKLDLHRTMVRIRHFEEAAGRIMEAGRVPGGLHLSVGQEAVAAGVMAHLRDTDQITSTHRGHGHLIAKGGDFRFMFAELFGKATGYCRGKGGSMHICDVERGMLGANGIVGAGLPIALGAAFSNNYRGTDDVAIAFFGDGAINEGTFHETANIAAVHRLPLLLVCENNLYAEYTPRKSHQIIVPAADRVRPYGMRGDDVDGMDVTAVHEAAGAAIADVRNGGGPRYLEFATYRYYDHVGVKGIGVRYRDDAERDLWVGRDPIPAYEARLAAEGVLSAKDAVAVHDAAEAEVLAAIEFAESSPDPLPSALLEDVYA